MYKRMLEKKVQPSFTELLNYCGKSGCLWTEFEKFLEHEFNAAKLIRFPYGKEYGWGVKYSYKNKHICDVFAENGAFTVMFRIDNKAVEPIYNELDSYTKSLWDNKYPCNEGGWINYRVNEAKQLNDLQKLISAKMDKSGKLLSE